MAEIEIPFVVNAFRSALVWGLIAAVTIFFSVIMAVVRVVSFPFDPDKRIIHPLISMWARSVLVVCPLMRIRFRFDEKLKNSQPYIFVANHQSHADILAVLHLAVPFKFIAKKELFWIPFFGWGLSLAGHIPLIRGDRSSGLQTLNRCEYYLKRGMSVLFFPEGTRSPDGDIQPFKAGAFKLAADLNLPVVPLTIDGTRGLLPKGKHFFEKRVDVFVRVGKPRLGSGSDPMRAIEELKENTRREMICTLKDMRTQGNS